MGYLDNTSVTVDAVLTKLGRQRLAEGKLNITKFALGDDEINYALYDTSHNLGTAYYGQAIERMPLLEAFTNDTQALTNKLVTLPKNTQVLPVITLAQSAVTLTTPGQSVILSPQTLNIAGATAAGYTFTIGNTDIVQLGLDTPSTPPDTSTSAFTDGSGGAPSSAQYIPPQTGNQLSGTIIGTSVKLIAYSLTKTQTTTLTITGVNTGGTLTIPVTISRDTTLD